MFIVYPILKVWLQTINMQRPCGFDIVTETTDVTLRGILIEYNVRKLFILNIIKLKV